jgi:hypothetical protein
MRDGSTMVLRGCNGQPVSDFITGSNRVDRLFERVEFGVDCGGSRTMSCLLGLNVRKSPASIDCYSRLKTAYLLVFDATNDSTWHDAI